MLGLAKRKTAVTTGVSIPVVLLLVAGAIFLVIGSVSSTIFAQQTVAGLAQGAIFGSLALALVLIYRATEVINFAQGELAMATTYIAYQLTIWGVTYWLAFFLTLWLNTGTLATKFENVLLFITYWVPPFAAIQMVDWWRKRGVMNVQDVLSGALKPGWDALIALLVGFGAAVPFMDTSLYVGPASSGWLQGGDIAFGVGFVVALVVYAGIRWLETGTLRDTPRAEPVPTAAGRH